MNIEFTIAWDGGVLFNYNKRMPEHNGEAYYQLHSVLYEESEHEIENEPTYHLYVERDNEGNPVRPRMGKVIYYKGVRPPIKSFPR